MRAKLCFLLLILAVLLSHTFVSADYSVGDASMLDSSITYDAAASSQYYPKLAYSPRSNCYLAAWTDNRFQMEDSLYVARITAGGALIDPVGKKLYSNEYSLASVDICYGNDCFFVVYAVPNVPYGYDIYGQRVSDSGDPIDLQPIPISIRRNNDWYCSVSWDGSNFFAVWEDTSVGNGDIYLTRISPSGALLDSQPIPISILATGEHRPRIASTQGKSLIVWQDDRNAATSTDIYGAVIHSSGQLYISNPMAICTDVAAQTTPACCWTGTDFKVVWSSNSAQIRGTRVDINGLLIDPSGWPVCDIGVYNTTPSITFNGTNSLVTWSHKNSSSEASDIYAVRMDSAGNRIDASDIPVCQAALSQALSCSASGNDSAFMVMWYSILERGASSSDLFARRMESTGAMPAPEFMVTTSVKDQKFPSSAYDGDSYLVCWEEMHDRSSDIYGAFVPSTCNIPVAQTVFPVATGITHQQAPAVTWNGENFLVSWIVDPEVHFCRVSRAGEILPPGDVKLAGVAGSYTWRPSLASDGNQSIVLYQMGTGMRCALLSREGIVLADRSVGSESSRNGWSSICWTGQEYFGAWGNPACYRRISRDGTPLGTGATLIEQDAARASVATNGSKVLIAWCKPYTESINDIRIRRFNMDATPLDSAPLTLYRAHDIDGLYATWDGINYIISWFDYSLRAYFAIRVGADGVPVDSTPIRITDAANPFFGFGRHCAGPNGRTLFAFPGWHDTSFNCFRTEALFFDDWTNVTSLANLITTNNGIPVKLTNRVVTAAFPADGQSGSFYVQDGQTCGIKVNGSTAVSKGDSVSITGSLKILDGERQLDAFDVKVLSSGNGIPTRLGMSIKSLGGTAPNARYETIIGGEGAYNIGLLSTIAGNVVERDTFGRWFKLNDGSTSDIKCILPPAASLDSTWNYVSVTGISSCEKVGSDIIPAFLVRSQEDIIRCQ